MLNSYFYILDGKTPKPTEDLKEWAEAFEKCNRTVSKTKLSDGVEISTVFLGAHHGLGDVPILFETMIFGGEHDEYCERYSTWDEAEAGHQRAVELASSDKSHP